MLEKKKKKKKQKLNQTSTLNFLIQVINTYSLFRKQGIRLTTIVVQIWIISWIDFSFCCVMYCNIDKHIIKFIKQN